jgi:hypothetical protein
MIFAALLHVDKIRLKMNPTNIFNEYGSCKRDVILMKTRKCLVNIKKFFFRNLTKRSCGNPWKLVRGIESEGLFSRETLNVVGAFSFLKNLIAIEHQKTMKKKK